MLTDLPVTATHGDFSLHILPAPLTAELLPAIHSFLGHKGDSWLWDIQQRYAGDAPDTCYLATKDGQPAGHIWIGRDRACPAIGTFGHVYTDPTHRGQGLASALTSLSLQHARDTGCQYLGLGVSNPQAARIYARSDFHTILAPADAGGQAMLWGAPSADAARAALYPAHPYLAARDFSRDHYSAACLLLCLQPEPAVIPALGMADGRAAEGRLIRYLLGDTDAQRIRVAVDINSGVVHAIQIQAKAETSLPPVTLGQPAGITVLCS